MRSGRVALAVLVIATTSCSGSDDTASTSVTTLEMSVVSPPPSEAAPATQDEPATSPETAAPTSAEPATTVPEEPAFDPALLPPMQEPVALAGTDPASRAAEL